MLMKLMPSQPFATLRPDRLRFTALDKRRLGAAAMVASLASAVLWSYWPTLTRMADRWRLDPQYSHGFLVPLFAAIILTVRRGMLTNWTWRPTWWGLPMLLVGATLRQ